MSRSGEVTCHFGGTLAGVNFSDYRKSLRRVGRKEIVKSPDLNSVFFHMNNPRPGDGSENRRKKKPLLLTFPPDGKSQRPDGTGSGYAWLRKDTGEKKIVRKNGLDQSSIGPSSVSAQKILQSATHIRNSQVYREYVLSASRRPASYPYFAELCEPANSKSHQKE